MGLLSKADLDRCICSRCPTYLSGDTGLFCHFGKSKLDVEEMSCLCRTCPVHIEYDLAGREYCIRGKPEEQ